ncbi:MAG: hypothetical protein M1813_004220 [Trichoglossum hirsutum]|jgi:hypothetical protein|nr:MAG: hypothetical protein M1813_004220 [Trichoglossum hirsutum]
MALPSSLFILPLPYRFFFLFLEPLLALTGAYVAHFHPQQYLHLTSPSTFAASSPVPLTTRVVLSQLANLYLLFAVNEALVLRATADLRVWRTVLVGLLVADLGHLWSLRELGAGVYWKVGRWSVMDWGNVGAVYIGALMRVCFLCGVGLPTKVNGGKGGSASARE